MRLQNELYGLRAETQAAFDEAKALQERWKDVDREQKELYSVRATYPTLSKHYTERLTSTIKQQ